MVSNGFEPPMQHGWGQESNGHGPIAGLRIWNYDGSSTEQADGHNSAAGPEKMRWKVFLPAFFHLFVGKYSFCLDISWYFLHVPKVIVWNVSAEKKVNLAFKVDLLRRFIYIPKLSSRLGAPATGLPCCSQLLWSRIPSEGVLTFWCWLKPTMPGTDSRPSETRSRSQFIRSWDSVNFDWKRVLTFIEIEKSWFQILWKINYLMKFIWMRKVSPRRADCAKIMEKCEPSAYAEVGYDVVIILTVIFWYNMRVEYWLRWLWHCDDVTRFNMSIGTHLFGRNDRGW